jgi:hypothetical protein
MKKEQDFKFAIGETVSHRLNPNIHLLIFQQQKRVMTNGIDANWYLCRIPTMAIIEVAEIELQPFKEIRKFKVDVNEWKEEK